MSGQGPADQTAYYNSHPPAAIAGLKPVAVSPGDVVLDGHGGEINAIFELACECGHEGFHVLAHDGDEWVVDPVHVRCAACARQTTIFDARTQGYDGALGHLPETPAPTSALQELSADGVGPAPYRVAVRYEYAEDVLADPDFADWRGREAELFTWFTVLVRPLSGGAFESVFDQECG